MVASTWRAAIASMLIATMMLFTACSGKPSSTTTTEEQSTVDKTIAEEATSSVKEDAVESTTTNDTAATKEPTGSRKSPIPLKSNEYAYGDGKILIDGVTFYEDKRTDGEKGTTYPLYAILHVKFDGLSENDLKTVNDEIALGMDADPPDDTDYVFANYFKTVDVESGQDMLFSISGSPESFSGKNVRVCVKDKTDGEKYFYYPVKVDSYISHDEMYTEAQRFGFTGID